MRALVVAAVGAALLTLVGCGAQTQDASQRSAPAPARASSQASDSAVDAAAVLPSCASVWVVGHKLQRHYEGCLVGGEPAQDPNPTRCESGQTLHTHGPRTYAVEGGKVIRTDVPLHQDRMFRRILAACTG
jgi:hypothetical protein